jgi:hypothetical protein
MQPGSPPYLPEPDPVAPPKSTKQAKKTLLLWSLLVVFFLAIWQVLTPSGTPRHEPELPACAPSFWSGSLALLLPLVLVVALVVLFLRTYRLSTDFNLSLERGRISLAEGRTRDAIGSFTQVAAAHAKRPPYASGALLWLAHAQLWAGRIDDAIASYVRLEKARGVLFHSQVRTLAASQLALAYGFAGQLDAADRWASETRARVAKIREDRMQCAAYLRLAEAVLAIRRGESARAAAMLDERWPLLREAFTANTMRIVEVVRAFAEAGGGVREYNRVGERLVRIEPTAPGEMAFLGARWPEMHAFLAAHGLAAGAAA